MLFDFLLKENLLDVTRVSHHVIQLIRQWGYAAHVGDELAVHADPSLTDRQVELIRRVVDSITAAEGKQLRDIPEDRVDRYVVQLSKLLQDATRREMHTSAEKGKELLDELRALYPGARARAA